MITLQDLKKEYVDKVLENIKKYNFQTFTNGGEYKQAVRVGRRAVKQYINSTYTMLSPETEVLSAGIKAYGFETELDMIVPLKPNETDINGEYRLVDEVCVDTENGASLDEFLADINNAFANVGNVVSIKEESTGNDWTGGVVFDYAVPDVVNQRDFVGQSIEVIVTISFALFEGGMTSQKVSIKVNSQGYGESELAVTDWQISLTPVLATDIFKKGKGEGTNYAESWAVSLSVGMPLKLGDNFTSLVFSALDIPTNGAVRPFAVELSFEDEPIFKRENMIFGAVVVNGGGTSNITAKITFVPYTKTEIDG